MLKEISNAKKPTCALRPPEEAFTALASDDAIVNARGLVSTDLARYYLDLSCNNQINVLMHVECKKNRCIL